VRDVVASGPTVLFIGQGDSGQEGIYLIEDGVTRTIADVGMIAPGTNAMFRGFIISAANDRGNVAFAAQADSTHLNLYAYVNGQLRLVLPAQVAYPEGGTFTTFDPLPDISGDTIAFKGFKGSGNYGVYSVKADGTGLTRLMDRDQAPPGGAQSFEALISFAYSEGVLVFHAAENGGASAGLYYAEGGSLFKILRGGELLDGKTIAGLHFTSREGLDRRQFCFIASFNDGSQAIYRGEIPETVQAPVLSFAREGDALTLSWSGDYKLQASSILVNPAWADVATVSPASVSMAETQGFFRLIGE
jgi:hypothetical protein